MSVAKFKLAEVEFPTVEGVDILESLANHMAFVHSSVGVSATSFLRWVVVRRMWQRTHSIVPGPRGRVCTLPPRAT